jgi:uncharacterized protein (TIGR02145 family)
MNNHKISAALILLFISFSCDKYNLVRTNALDPDSKNYKSIPVLTTTSAIGITSNSATGGGIVTNDGSVTITARGVTWSTSSNPTTANSKTTDGKGTGTFLSSISGLTGNTKYYVRAYATNNTATNYGNQVSFTTLPTYTVTDIDGNIYNTVTIDTKVWTKENLRTTRYNDGTSIPLVTDATAWSSLLTPGYCWYNNDAATYKATYGALYNWYTVNTGKLCPTGWHVPTDTDVWALITYLGGEDVAGGKLKEPGTTHWTSPNTGATNETGFTALPGAVRYTTFGPIGSYGYWWSSSDYVTARAWDWCVLKDYTNLNRSANDKFWGCSVRCIKD